MFTSFPPNEWKVSENRNSNSNSRMFTFFRPIEWNVFEKGKWPPNMKLSRGSTSSDLCKLSYPHYDPRISDGTCPKDVALRCVDSALSSFNEQSQSEQGPKYELVDALNCIKDSDKGVYHCNFIARLQNKREAHDKLFFAELVYSEGPVLRCPVCCIIGPRGTETGEYGCKSCLRHPGLIQHPGDGFWRCLTFFGKVSISQSFEEIKFPTESASTLSFDGRCPKNAILESAESALSRSDEQSLSKQGSSPCRNCGNGPLSCYRSSPPRFDGKCPKNLILESAESHVSSSDKQSLSKEGSSPQRDCGKCPLSCYRSSAPLFDGKCPKNMILGGAESAVSSSDKQSLSKKGRVGAFGRPLWLADYDPLARIPGLSPEYLVREHAECALSSFNEQSLSKQGPEFKLVDALSGMGLARQGIYHCNFIARLKNESEAVDMLFFAEINREGPVPFCVLCCILGPSGIKTGEHGCWSCLRQPGLVQHPKDGFNNVESYAEVYDNAGQKVLLRESVHGPGLCNFWKVNKSQSREENVYPWLGSASTLSASTLSKRPRPDDGHCCNSNLPYPPAPLHSFDGRCPKNTIHESAESALSSSDEQSLSKQGSSPWGNRPLSFSRSSPPRFGGKCPKKMILESAESPVSSSDKQNLSKQGSSPQGNCGNSPLSCYQSSTPRFDGKCRKNMIPGGAESAVSSSDKQILSKKDCVGAFGQPFWLADYDPLGRIPGLSPKYLVHEHAEYALSSFNEQSLSKQGPEYELVEALSGMGLVMQNIFHCNFIARLKNESEAADMLFFAEVKRGGPVPLCILCCILGPSGIRTGEHGCCCCLRQPGLVQHPEDGFSNVESYAGVYDKAGRNVLLRKSVYGLAKKSQSGKEIKYPWA